MGAVDGMVSELSSLQSDIDTAQRNIEHHDQRLNQLNNFTNRLQTPAIEALNTVVELANLVVELNTASDAGQDTIVLVRKCKTTSIVANGKFEKMHQIAKELLQDANNLATDLTYQVTTAQTRQNRVHEMQSASTDRRANDVQQLEMRRNQVSDAEREIHEAHEAKHHAERVKGDAEGARIARNIFTLGFGELFDWWGLNRMVWEAEQAINSSMSNLHASQAKLNEARENIERVDGELRQLDGLDSNLGTSMSRLREQSRMAHNILKTTQELRDNTFEAAHCLSALCGKSSSLFAQHTANKLAHSVLSIHAVMSNQQVKLIGPFFHNPSSLYGTLETIAHSPADGLPIDDMI